MTTHGFFTKPSIFAGNSEYKVALAIFGTADEKAPVIEQFDLGLENGLFLLDHLQGNISPVATDLMGCDLQSPASGQAHYARLPHTQVETFTAEQAIRGVVEHGLQFADVPFQLGIDGGVIASGQDGVHADPAAFLGQQESRGTQNGEHRYRKHQQPGRAKPHLDYLLHSSLR